MNETDWKSSLISFDGCWHLHIDVPAFYTYVVIQTGVESISRLRQTPNVQIYSALSIITRDECMMRRNRTTRRIELKINSQRFLPFRSSSTFAHGAQHTQSATPSKTLNNCVNYRRGWQSLLNLRI